VVQSLVIELGQSVVMGEHIALVGSFDQLYVMLSVAQSDMEFIELSHAKKVILGATAKIYLQKPVSSLV
jgi:hypothetical protein